MRLSGPAFLTNSVKTPRVPLPLTGRIKANGTKSGGKPMISMAGPSAALRRASDNGLLSPALSSKGGPGEPRPAGLSSCKRKIGKLARIFAIATAERAAHAVAMIEVPTIAVGLVERFAARIAIAVTGMSCTELVLIARKVHM